MAFWTTPSTPRLHASAPLTPHSQTPPPGESFYNSIYGVPKKPKNFAQWVETAQKNTKELLTYGSTSPLVWVLVRGNNIPPNAIVAGEEHRKPLYIARTFYEGSICIGKAGAHLENGACFAYNGREITAEIYEVLVPAFLPVRYSISEKTKAPHIPRIQRNGEIVEQAQTTHHHHHHHGIERLDNIKTVVLVDDSASMYDKLWPIARNALAGVVDLNSKHSSKGIDVYFLNSTEFGLDLKSSAAAQRLFDSVIPQGETPTGERLQFLIDKYLPLVENKHSDHRPISLVVITDGEPTDDATTVIVNAAKHLEKKKSRTNCFGIHFLQIGDDPDATDALVELDSVSRRYNVRNIVETTPHNVNDPHFTADTITKTLLKFSIGDTSTFVSPVPRNNNHRFSFVQ